MNPVAGEMVGSFFITLTSILVLGITTLLILYKMIDGEFRAIPGITGIFATLLLFFVVVKPPHPAVPAVALIVVITLVAFFPYALTTLDKAEMHGIDIEQMEKAYNALALKPDNTSALFQFAKGLHANGFKAHAIALASSGLATISTEVDQVGNRSVRDMFRAEEIMLRNWKEEAAKSPPRTQPIRCPSCGHLNEPGPILCSRCGEPYLLYVARAGDSRIGVLNKLLLAWALVAAFFVGFVAIALRFEGVARIIMLCLALAAVAFVISRLFRRPAGTRD